MGARARATLLLGALVAMLATGCSDRRTTPEIRSHPPEWTDPESRDFHGVQVATSGASTCYFCHGATLTGDSRATGCFECHGVGEEAGHPVGWVAPSQHGGAVEARGPQRCRVCHGSDYQGGWVGVSCFDCHEGPGGHPEGWPAPGSANFHGAVVVAEGDADCRRCHGEDLEGGTSGLACVSPGCHTSQAIDPSDVP